jgi:hypothetical protein
MITYALTRVIRNVTHYLNERYQWQRLPHVFPEWHFGVVLDLAMRFPDPAQRVGEVIGGDLDRAKWTELR